MRNQRMPGQSVRQRETTMYFDRFDIVEAYYLAFSHCHGGQWSREYARMCRMLRYFQPGRMLSEDTLTDNGREIYAAACARMLGTAS
jgi:hypothetical protein